MPFPTLNSQGFTALEDSQFFKDTPIDGAMKYETDGGLVITRRRFTRSAGRNLVTGFTMISPVNKQLLDAYFQSVSGGADPFNYIHPTTAENLVVRFDGAYDAIFKGIGYTWMWTIQNIKLRTT